MPARRDAVTIPADIASDSRVITLAMVSGVDMSGVVYAVIRAFSALAKVGGDAARMELDLPGNLTRWFLETMLDNGRCPLYDEFNGARDRHRARCRATVSKYRGKKAVRKKTAPAISGFDAAWATYPKRSGGNPRTLAAKAWAARVREGVSEEELALATKHYAAHCATENKTGTPYVMQGATFYGTGERWRDFTTAPADPELDEIMAEIRHNFQED